MFRSRSQTSPTLGDTVEVILSLLTAPAINALLVMQEEELNQYQAEFAETICEHLELEEDDLLDLCYADDVETAAARLIKATWREAKLRLLH